MFVDEPALRLEAPVASAVSEEKRLSALATTLQDALLDGETGEYTERKHHSVLPHASMPTSTGPSARRKTAHLDSRNGSQATTDFGIDRGCEWTQRLSA